MSNKPGILERTKALFRGKHPSLEEFRKDSERASAHLEKKIPDTKERYEYLAAMAGGTEKQRDETLAEIKEKLTVKEIEQPGQDSRQKLEVDPKQQGVARQNVAGSISIKDLLLPKSQQGSVDKPPRAPKPRSRGADLDL